MRDLFDAEHRGGRSSTTREVHRARARVHRQADAREASTASSCTRGRGRCSTSYGVEQDFEKIFARRIELPSGGSIVFDQTEALVAIDVNSGKTRSDGFDFEEIALKTNLEAAPEIARQIRLRDLGGIIVVDFIDMHAHVEPPRGRARAARRARAGDRARSKLGRISPVRPARAHAPAPRPGPLEAAVPRHCPRCRGSGRLRTVESRAGAILRRLGSALTLKGFTTVEVRTQPEVDRVPQAQLLRGAARARAPLRARDQADRRRRPARGQRPALPARRRPRSAPRRAPQALSPSPVRPGAASVVPPARLLAARRLWGGPAAR